MIWQALEITSHAKLNQGFEKPPFISKQSSAGQDRAGRATECRARQDKARQGRAGQGRKVKGAPGSKQAGQAGQLAAGFSFQPITVPVAAQGFL